MFKMVQLRYFQTLTGLIVLAAFQVVYSSDSDKWCPDGMVLNDDICFEPYFERETPYEVAKEICKEDGGQVALGSNNQITNILTRIALKHRFENYWVKNDENLQSHQCQAIMFRNYFEVSTEHCNNAMFYICQFDFEVSNSSKFENKYFKFSEDRRKFSEAQKSCASLGGKIAQLDNEVVNFLIEEINKDKTWERFSDWQLENLHFSYYPYIWAGASLNSETGQWVSAAGTPVDDSFQHLSQVKNAGQCVHFSKNSLSIGDCDEYNLFLCQFPASERLTAEDTSLINWRVILSTILSIVIPVTVIQSKKRYRFLLCAVASFPLVQLISSWLRK